MKVSPFLSAGMYGLLAALIVCAGMMATSRHTPSPDETVANMLTLQQLQHPAKPATKPNNQYELHVYQDHYDLKDGARLVNIIKVGEDKVLDSLVEYDNR